MDARVFAFLAMGSVLCHAADAPMVPLDSQEWRELFEPAYTTPTELPMDSPLRKELFNLLRPRIEAASKKPVKFRGQLRAFRNWAFFAGSTVDSDGDSVKLPPMHNDDTVALWLRTRDGWRLVDFSGGHSDAFHVLWPEQYGVPKELIGIE